MIPMSYFLILSSIVFAMSFAGIIINRKNFITMLMCVELMLLSVNTNFITISQYLNLPVGEIFVFFILAIAAAESVIGLAILVLLFRQRGTINVDDISILKG